MGLDMCDVNATCVDLVGSYDCLCDEGFMGDGYNCSSELVN